MAIVSARNCKLLGTTRALVVMLGRRSSTELNAIRYRGRTDWAASDTAWAATGGVADAVTVQLTIAENTQSITITDPDEDSARMVRHFVLPSLTAGVHPYRLEITSGANDIGNLVFGFVVVAKSSASRITATSCFGNGTPAALLNENIAEDWYTGDTDDNAVTSQVAPVNGSAAPLLRRMLAEQPTHWFHIDDAVYVGLTQQPTRDEAPPRTLTSTSDDAPVTLQPMFGSNAGYTNSVAGASKSRNATAAQQMIYLWYEYSFRRRDVFNACLQGAEYYRVIGDNDVFNDFDMSWWSLAFNPASGGQRFDGMTTAAGDPYLTATFNPADFTNATNRTNQIEANTYWRLLRSVWGLYVTPYSPPAISTTSQTPWIVRQLEASAGADPDYNADDYIPLSWKYDLDSHTSVIAWDFFTSQDLNVITTESSLNPVNNNYIQLNAAGTHYLDGSGNNLRVTESPLGDANDSALKAQLATQQDAGRNVLLLLPKELGSVGRGNRDGLWRRNAEWIKGIYNTTFAALSKPLLGIAGDWHIPTAIKNTKFMQLGVSPSSPISLSETPDAGEDWDSLTFNVSGITDTVSNITSNPSWTLDANTTGNDLYRFAYAAVVCESGKMSAYQVEQRGGEVVTLHTITTAISAVGGALPLAGVFTMARDKIRSVLGEQGTFDGIGILCSGTGQQLAGGSVYHPLQRANGTVACVIVGAANRSTGPSGNRGPVFSVLVGEGDITSAATTLADKVAQLPPDFTISNGGYTLSASDLTHAEDVTLYGVTIRTYRYSGGSASEYFGGSSLALVPTVARWTASEAGISIGDRRRSIDSDIELYAESAGTAGTTEPPVTGTYGNTTTISDGTLNWGQAISSEQIEFDVTWTDSSAGGGSADVDHYLNGLPRSADGAIVTVTGS